MLQRLHKGFKGTCQKNVRSCAESRSVNRDPQNYETIFKNIFLSGTLKK